MTPIQPVLRFFGRTSRAVAEQTRVRGPYVPVVPRLQFAQGFDFGFDGSGVVTVSESGFIATWRNEAPSA